MRVLYARVGIPYSPFTGKPIESQTITQMVDKIKELPKKSTIYLFAPVVRGRKGEYKKEISSYKKHFIHWTQKNNKSYCFKLLNETGKSHKKKFELGLFLEGKNIATANAGSKKKAEEAAAEIACNTLNL